MDAAPTGCIAPDWGAPRGVHAFVTTRAAPGVSTSPYDRCNLGDHVDDDPAAVAQNRAGLRRLLQLPGEPLWLRQVHGIEVCDADAHEVMPRVPPTADAARTTRAGRVLAVMTADCLPLLLCADDGSEIAAVHAGWRGLAAGVIEATVARMHSSSSRLLAWLGPAIGPQTFEVGADVRAAFVDRDPATVVAFRARPKLGKHLCDIYALARRRLALLGIERVSGGTLCTVSDPARFYSHRRDRVTGRMASLIWIESQR